MKHLSHLAIVAIALTSCNKSEKPIDRPVSRKPPPNLKVDVPLKQAEEKRPEIKDEKKWLTDERVVVTPRAAKEISRIMKDGKLKYLRISVSDDDLKLDLDPSMDAKNDLLSESRGIPIIVDRRSSVMVPVGIVVDFVDDEGRKGFKFTGPDLGPPDLSQSLAEAPRGFKTKLATLGKEKKTPPQVPPAHLFRLVKYDSEPGRLSAYLSPDPDDGKKHPAIVWITGGDCNSIDSGCWLEGSRGNDQSASVYRKAGIVMMFPALRGGNDNHGNKEGFLGEVDDIRAAADFLSKQEFVDPKRVYLGGHSTGGTLVLLTAECHDCFRAVFSFGPVANVAGYGPRYNPFFLSHRKELLLRAPGLWLHSIKTPVFIFEGEHSANAVDLMAMAKDSKNADAHFFEIKGTDHFALLAPTNQLIAQRILKDTGPTCNLAFTEEELNKPFEK